MNYLPKFFFCLFPLAFLFFSNTTFAQQYIVKGKLVDQSKLPVEFVNINLFKDGTTLTKQVVTDSLGAFSITAESGNYFVIGEQFKRELFRKNISLDSNTDIGVVQINDAVQLDGVTLSVKKKLIERKVDRLIFNVENSIASQGVDGLEALSNVPLLRVDERTGISIAGKSGLSVMINERMVNLSGTDLMNYLKSLRSDNIAKIEVITTPPAKYEAQGNSGIINIVLKKNKNLGWSGNIGVGLTQRSFTTGTTNTTVNYQSEKLSVSVRFWYYNSASKANENYSIVGNNSSISKDKRKDFDDGWSTDLSLDYKLSDKSNIGVIYDYSFGNSNMDINNSTIYQTNNVETQRLSTYSEHRSKEKMHTLNTYYDLKFGDNKLSIVGNYFSNVPVTNVNFTTKSNINNTNNIVRNLSDIKYSIWSGQADLNLPMKFAEIETGIKFTEFQNKSDVRYLNYNGSDYVVDQTKSNLFDYNEKNYAIYAGADKKINDKLSVKLGLRYEYSSITGFSPVSGEQNKREYGYFFPTVYTSYTVNDNNSLTLNYSKRINRPGFRALNPFRWYSNPYSYSSGNPSLSPSITHNVELAYVYKNSYSATAYFQRTLNNYGQIAILNGINNTSTYENYYNQNTYGINLSYTANLIKWWELSTSADASYNLPDVFRFSGVAQKGYALSLSANNTFTLDTSKTIFFFLNHMQTFASRSNNEFVRPMGSMDVGLKFLLMDKNLQISTSVRDIFEQMKKRGTLYFADNMQYFDNYYDSRRFNLSLTYRFGSKNVKGNRKQVDFDEKNRTN